MSEYHVVLGIVASVIGAAAYVPYFRDIFRGTTKPHPFTWLVFAILNGVVFFGQVAAGAGPGAWITGMTAIATLSLAVVGFYASGRYIVLIDYVCLAGGILGVVLWFVTKEPLTAIIVATITDMVAFIPTIRKAYEAPETETASMYVLGTMKYALSLFALDSFNLTTALFPASISTINILFLIMVWLRRRQLRTP